MSSGLPWSNRPPFPPVARIFETPSTDCQLVLLGTWWAHWVHWQGRRTVPCLEEECPAQRHRLPAHWVGYVPAVVIDQVDRADGANARPDWARCTKTVLRITDAHALEITSVEVFPMLARLRRRKNRHGYELRELKRLTAPIGLPEPFDVRPSVYRLYGIRPPAESNGEHITEGE